MRLGTAAFFRQLRQYSQSVINSASRTHFFVDTNVILGYRLDQYAGLKEFVTYPGHQFFYTDTVLQELCAKEQQVPEANPDTNKDTFFRYVRSGISDYRKTRAIKFFHDFWQEKFMGIAKQQQRGFGLTERQLDRFEKDILIIMESGYVCHAPGVLPDDDFRTPSLLTNNMRLVNKFILRHESRQALDDAIDTLGLERLMPVELLEEAIDEWERSLLVKNNNPDAALPQNSPTP